MDVDGLAECIEHGIIFDNSNVPIRALYVESIHDCDIEWANWTRLHKHLEKFGEIEYGRIIGDSLTARWLIRYKNADSVKNVLSMYANDLSYNYYPIIARAAALWQQPDYRAEPPDQESEANILNVLNDDCLYAVFRHLGLLDLAKVAEVCVRFNRLAHDTFSTVYKGQIKFGREFTARYEDIDIVLRNFGSKIERLNMFELEEGKDVFSIINQYCTSATSSLSKLRINGIRFCTGDEKFCPVFAKLEKLEMRNCLFLDESESLITACSELKELTISLDRRFNTNRSFPKLEKFSISETWWNDTQFNQFLSLNPTLKKLFTSSNRNLHPEDVIGAVGENLTHLVELEIAGKIGDRNKFDTEILKLKWLRFLKVLKLQLDWDGSSMEAIVGSELPITQFIVVKGKIDNKTVQSISRMKQITSLGFEECDYLSNEHLIALVKELPQLKELTFTNLRFFEHPTSDEKINFNCIKMMLSYATNLRILQLESYDTITISIDDYKAVLECIKNRPGRPNLLIKVNPGLWRTIKLKIPQETLLKNCKFLSIQGLYY